MIGRRHTVGCGPFSMFVALVAILMIAAPARAGLPTWLRRPQPSNGYVLVYPAVPAATTYTIAQPTVATTTPYYVAPAVTSLTMTPPTTTVGPAGAAAQAARTPGGLLILLPIAGATNSTASPFALDATASAVEVQALSAAHPALAQRLGDGRLLVGFKGFLKQIVAANRTLFDPRGPVAPAALVLLKDVALKVLSFYIGGDIGRPDIVGDVERLVNAVIGESAGSAAADDAADEPPTNSAADTRRVIVEIRGPINLFLNPKPADLPTPAPPPSEAGPSPGPSAPNPPLRQNPLVQPFPGQAKRG